MSRDAGTIESIATWRWGEQSNCLWIEVETSQGLVGLGETFYQPGAVEAILHESVAPWLLGRSAEDIKVHSRDLFAQANFAGFAGAEMRAFSALDIALWDILGQALDRPIWALLGGRFRDAIRIYNTCVDAGDYQDSRRFLEEPAALARELVDQGVTALKVWPFDFVAPSFKSPPGRGPAGSSAVGPPCPMLTRTDLKSATAVIAAIRDEVGDEADVLLEGHSRWDLNTAIRILREVEQFDLLWAEDMIQPDSADDLRRLAEATSVPQAVSERLIGRHAYRDVLVREAARILMLDVAWTGGITEASRIADLADAFHLPFAPHDCTGPVAALANVHLAIGHGNAMIVETVRGFYTGYYLEVIDRPLPIDGGLATAPDGPGLGARLRPEFKARDDVTSRRSRR
jgi:L-alanine-DL-glutamate epimerase-like enolase superfamily enzyme